MAIENINTQHAHINFTFNKTERTHSLNTPNRVIDPNTLELKHGYALTYKATELKHVFGSTAKNKTGIAYLSPETIEDHYSLSLA